VRERGRKGKREGEKGEEGEEGEGREGEDPLDLLTPEKILATPLLADHNKLTFHRP